MAKSCYKAAHGQWMTDYPWIKRDDWAAAVIAQARVSLWRTAWQVGQNEPGRWPLGMDTDCLYYAADPGQGHPFGEGRSNGIVIGDGLGQFQLKGQWTSQQWNRKAGA